MPDTTNIMKFSHIFLLWLLIAASANGKEDDWFESFDVDTDHVNEGILVFHTRSPEKPVHHLDNQIVITASSLKNGWVKLLQCHEHIDNVPAAQIVFNRSKIRNLAVRDFEGIAAAWVEGASVQLKQVGKAAKLCLNAETRALSEDELGGYLLKNGPYMRRFLDGYYPMRVSFSVIKPVSLKLVSVTPSPQPGFSLNEENDTVRFEALFEGRLNTELRFIAP